MVRQTLVEKQSVFRLLFKALDPTTPLDEITAQDAAAFLNAQFAARGGNAANGDRKNLAAWWSWAKGALGVEENNPLMKVRRFPEVREPRVIPTEANMQTLLDNEKGEVRLFLFTLLHTAARVGELFRLRWDDLDVDRRTLWLWTRKRRSGSLEHDLIPMTEELRVELLAHKRQAHSVFVFCRADGQPYTQRIQLMKRVCKRNGITEFGFHGIRHLSASALYKAGYPIAVIQKVLRHKSANTTARYLHDLIGIDVELDSAFKRLEDATGNGKSKTPEACASRV
jgi:integrase